MSTPESTEEAIKAVRPLAQSQNRNLIKIIETDYAVLRQQVNDFANEQIAAKKKEIKAASSPANQRKAEDAAGKAIRKYQAKRKELIRMADDWGITLNMPSLDEKNVSATNSKLQADLAAAEAEIRKEEAIALSDLTKAELAAKRKVYQASVSEAAERVQATLPTAEQSMLQAAQTRAARAELES